MNNFDTNWNQRYVDGDVPWQDQAPSPEMVHMVSHFVGKPCKVLEVGCGAAIDGAWFIDSGYDYTGIDSAPNAIKRAKSHCQNGGQFEVADVMSYVPNQSFDLIYDRGLMHSLSEHEAYVDRLSQLLNPNGFVVLIAGNGDHPENPEDVQKYGYPRMRAGDIIDAFESQFYLHYMARCRYGRKHTINDFLGWSAVWQLRR